MGGVGRSCRPRETDGRGGHASCVSDAEEKRLNAAVAPANDVNRVELEVLKLNNCDELERQTVTEFYQALLQRGAARKRREPQLGVRPVPRLRRSRSRTPQTPPEWAALEVTERPRPRSGGTARYR